jgi:hypothetical protein
MKQQILNIVIFLIIGNNLVLGQVENELLFNLNSDLNYFKKAIQSSHPSVYQYISKSTLDSLFIESQFEASDNLSNKELEKRIRLILSKIGCVHTYIVKPKRTTSKVFPVFFYAQNDELFVIKDLEKKIDVNKKYKVLSINGNTSESIINKMKDYRPSDGYNSTFKYQLINSASWFSKMYEFYFDSDSIKTINLIDSVYNSIQIKRNLILIEKHNTTNNTANDYQFGKSVKLNFHENNIAVLKINSFSGVPLFGKYINGNHYKKALKAIGDNSMKTLIIDLRNNTGGDALSGYRFVSHFIDEKHRVTIQHHKGEIFKYATFKSKSELVLSLFLGNLFSGRIPQFKDRKSYVKIKPRKKIYKGKVFVLTNGLTLSTASNVASIFKHKTDAVLVGEETGGGENILNAYVFPKIKLPYSQIMIQIPQYRINLCLENKASLGVPPEIEIFPDFQPVVSGKDWMLNEILHYIHTTKDH